MDSHNTPLLDIIARDVAGLAVRTIVGVDGVDGAGKTVFANALAHRIEALGCPVLRAGIDGFHNPRSTRYKRGKNNPEGFFQDSFNYDSLRQYLIEPFRLGASTVETARFSYKPDQEVINSFRSVPSAAVLVFDGIFLHRPELDGLWDRSIFLDVPFSVSFGRLAERDGMNPDPAAPENYRYLEGQNIYLRICQPRRRASYLIDNSDFNAPRLASEPFQIS